MAASAIETHPQRLQIIEAIRQGKSLRAVASCVNPPVSVGSVMRLKRSLSLHDAVMGDLAVIQQVNPTKPWVEQNYVRIVNAALEGKHPDLAAARSGLDSICRMNGYDAPRRTESLNLNLHALSTSQIAQHLQASIASLPEAQRKQLLAEDPSLSIDIESDSVT